MTATSLDIAIAGAGFAGLATAVLLAGDGHRVTVFEKFEQPRSLGAGILVQPSGLAAMRVLGVEQEVLAHGARIEHLYGVAANGRPVVDVHYGRWQRGSFGLGLHRGVLFDALWRRARESGVTLVTGHEVHRLAPLQAQHALVVVSDGSHSKLRPQTGLPCRDVAYPWGAVWAVLQDPGARRGRTLWQWYRGAREMLGIMPTGRETGSGVPMVSLFWSLRADRFDHWREAGLDRFRQALLALHPGCEDLLAQLRSVDDLTWARYRDVAMPRYHEGNCVVIGDAAHATSPQLGQGTNLALLDAIALRQCLRQGLPVSRALAHYSDLRRGHTRFYGQASRWLTPLFQSDLPVLPWLRDLFMAPSARWPWVGRLTFETLVGVRRGWLGARALDLEAVEKG